MTEVTVLIGAGAIGLAIARRVSAGRHVLVADLHQKHADAVANTLNQAGFATTTAVVDVASRASVRALAEQAQSISAALQMGADGAFITASDVLMDGGFSAASFLRRAGTVTPGQGASPWAS